MKKLLFTSCSMALATVALNATPVFSDNFNGYSAGNLVGQGPWTQTGTSTLTPLQVTGAGKVAIGTSGQDANAAVTGGPISIADGSSFYIGLTLNVSAAQATGDYFLHFDPTAGDTSAFIDRLFIKSSGAGFVLGWVETSGGAAVAYGSSVLNFGTDYRVVMAYHAVAGPLNDTGALYVNPFTDPSVELNNTAYVTKSWTSTTAENDAVGSINLRQGTASSAPTLVIDDLVGSQTFSDATAVPEPQTLFMAGGFGLLALRLFRKRH